MDIMLNYTLWRWNSSRWLLAYCSLDIASCICKTETGIIKTKHVNEVSTSTSPCASLWFEHQYSLVHLGLQVKWNQFSSNNSHHTSCIHKGLHAGKWPDLMTPKTDSVSTLGYHWTDHTGRPLEPHVHCDATGTTLADASTQRCSNGDPVLICIIGTHWNPTGRSLEDHWEHTGNTLATKKYFSPVAFQYTLEFKFQAHWIATGLPLNYHWLREMVGGLLTVTYTLRQDFYPLLAFWTLKMLI